MLDGCLRDDRWHLAPIQQEGTRVRLSLGWWDEKQQEAGEVLLEVDTAQSFAPVRFRGLSLSANGKGTGHEVQWSKYSDPGEGAPPLAGRMVRWDFNYYGPRERGWLEWTQVFDWLQLACTSPSSRRPSLPRFADFDDSLSSTVLPPEDQGSCFGGAVSHAARGFAGQAAPEPPADLAALDVKAEVARIRGEYGYK